MGNQRKYLVTSALPYANGPLHLGHIAGAYLPADIFVRYLRDEGDDVVFICGSDEHGAAITIKAKKENTTPQQVVDKYHVLNKDTFERFGISFDYYDRTSAEHHHKTAQDFFLDLYEKGVFEKKESEQFYDGEHRQFLADRYIMGTCPKCGHDKAYGDQCEKCGSSLSPSDLKNPVSVLSGKKPELKKTFHWYLPMQKHEDWLREWLESGKLDGEQHHDPKAWKHQVLGQCKSWIDGGLQSRAMTRDLDWGVKVPLEDAGGKVLYVWLDAPIGYISSTKAWAEEHGLNGEAFWQDKDRKLVHFIGKDNIVFHCIIFPILLKLHGGYNLPDNVPANEFLNLEGSKLSTSRNWAVWLHEYLEDMPHREDELRYVLTSVLPEYRDSEFTWKDYQARVNGELVAILGNFVNRTLVLTHKYFNGKIPEISSPDPELAKQTEEAYKKVDEHIRAYNFRLALIEAMRLARIGNKYLADREPWKLIKTDEQKTAAVLNNAIQITAHLCRIFRPFLPNTTQKLMDMLVVGLADIDKSEFTVLPQGHVIGKPELLFQKVEDKDIERQVEKLKANKKMKTKEETEQGNIQFEDFTKMEIVVAEVTAAEKVEKADKLLKLTLNTGKGERTVVSGIAQHYKPDEVIGKKVLYLANLEPRKIFGVQSQGMVLMAEDEEGKLSFMGPEKEDMAVGSVVR